MVDTIIDTFMFDKEFTAIVVYFIYELILRWQKAFIAKSNT